DVAIDQRAALQQLARATQRSLGRGGRRRIGRMRGVAFAHDRAADLGMRRLMTPRSTLSQSYARTEAATRTYTRSPVSIVAWGRCRVAVGSLAFASARRAPRSRDVGRRILDDALHDLERRRAVEAVVDALVERPADLERVAHHRLITRPDEDALL